MEHECCFNGGNKCMYCGKSLAKYWGEQAAETMRKANE